MNKQCVRSRIHQRMRSVLVVGGMVLASTPVSLLAQHTIVAGGRLKEELTVLQRPVTVRLERVTLERAVNAVAASAQVRLNYQMDLVESIKTPVTINVSRMPLGEALAKVLVGTKLYVIPSGDDVVAIREMAATSVTDGVIVGKVTSGKSKQPVVGATVVVDDASKGVQTDEQGAFRITTTVGTHRVTVRAIGFVRETRQVTVTENAIDAISFALEPSASVLNEVVVTGTVVATERKAIPTPITVITGEDLEKRGITRIEQLFRGEVPGVVALEQGDAVFSSKLGSMAKAAVYSRGATSLSGAPNPLKTYVDGVELLDPNYLGTIDPKSIERIEIITGPQAATIYGSGAMGGVMQIFTKKGRADKSAELVATVKYGILESTWSSNLTPSHNDAINITGGLGPSLTYSAGGSYVYSGQWQPFLFSRSAGASAGLTHQRGPLNVSASASLTNAKNGTYKGNAPYRAELSNTGTWTVRAETGQMSQTVGTSSSQLLGLTVDYRLSDVWQLHVTVGRSQQNFALVPQAPTYSSTSDTLYSFQGSTGTRTSLSYNTTLMPKLGSWVSSNLTIGANGSWGENLNYTGSSQEKNNTSFTNPTLSRLIGSSSVGGFAQWQIGVASQLFFNFGLRGEHNPNYGRERRIDWTPTNGVTYTIERGDLSLKMLASYGSATKPPTPEQRQSVTYIWSGYEPTQNLGQLEAPQLRPEHSYGPQGGIELYYGNVGSLTVNRYRQTINDLIILGVVGRGGRTYLQTGVTDSFPINQYLNLGRIGQQGWEGTASMNLGALNVKGTYSWNESRVLALAEDYLITQMYASSLSGNASYLLTVGSSFVGVPTHTGNVTASYAHRGTSVVWSSNWVGASTQNGLENPTLYYQVNTRLRIYTDYFRQIQMTYVRPGYVKSDVAASQRITPRVSFTLNVTNVANRAGAESSVLNPALGRTTLLGVSVRQPLGGN